MTQANRREFVTSLAALPVALVDTGRTMQTSILPELLQKSAIELSQAISSKAVSCREVMATYLDHIERINPKVNAIVSLQDRDGLLQNAQERDAQLSRGEYQVGCTGFRTRSRICRLRRVSVPPAVRPWSMAYRPRTRFWPSGSSRGERS